MEEFSKFNRNKSKPYVFASKTAFGKLDVKKAWQEAIARADIKNLRFHDLRHHFATEIAKNGASTVEIKIALGHKTLQMVERYTHLQAEATRKYSDEIAKQIMEDSDEANC